jgi:hypothetical protein
MVGEMANSIAEVLAERLKGTDLAQPLLHGFAALLKLVGRERSQGACPSGLLTH